MEVQERHGGAGGGLAGGCGEGAVGEECSRGGLICVLGGDPVGGASDGGDADFIPRTICI